MDGNQTSPTEAGALSGHHECGDQRGYRTGLNYTVTILKLYQLLKGFVEHKRWKLIVEGVIVFILKNAYMTLGQNHTYSYQ